jgi:hypothetical protein
MNMDVVIPTFMREEKLRRTLASIHTALGVCNFPVNVKVFYSDPDEKLRAEKDLDFSWLEHKIYGSEDFRAPVFWNDYLKTMDADALVYLTDDVLIDRYCLLIASEHLKKMDFDGVIGFNIDNRVEEVQPCLAAFGVLGAKFADRFPGREVFCPDYYSLFADVELEKYAKFVGRFKFEHACKLVHFHPAYAPDEADETHLWTRRRVSREAAFFEMRQSKGLLWGRDFERVNKEEVNA